MYHKDREGYTPDVSMIDLYSRMYSPINPAADAWHSKSSIEEFFANGQTDEDFKGRKMPYVLCEYIHAMGNGPGDAEDYQQEIMNRPGFVGGFVWNGATTPCTAAPPRTTGPSTAMAATLGSSPTTPTSAGTAWSTPTARPTPAC